MVRAIRGDSDRARADGIEALALSERISWAVGVSQSRYGLGYLALSEGDSQAAVTILEPVVASIEALGLYEWPTAMALPDAIEAFVATRELDRAQRLTDALAASGRKFDRPWALATSGRCRALVEAAAGHAEKACVAAEQAIVDHQRLSMPLELGRTLLVLGQLQRRRGKRREARETLQRALAIFEGLGAPLWTDRARAEIRRIGIRRGPQHMTEGEQRVAELAARGLTNHDIAAALFLSRRTVEANLARAYRKLGIGSRGELGAVMAERRAALVAARP
jgi:DNA-binding CsgD family transcriptional regulator